MLSQKYDFACFEKCFHAEVHFGMTFLEYFNKKFNLNLIAILLTM